MLISGKFGFQFGQKWTSSSGLSFPATRSLLQIPKLQLLTLLGGNTMVLHGGFDLGPGAPDVRFHFQQTGV
jgi:hypothetical protein